MVEGQRREGRCLTGQGYPGTTGKGARPEGASLSAPGGESGRTLRSIVPQGFFEEMTGIADTGFLVAFANRNDRHHGWAVEIAKGVTDPLLTCDAVLAETAFHLG